MNWLLAYFLIGAIYTLINGFVRKLDTDGDFMLGFIWLFFWPIAFITLGLRAIDKFRKKRKENDEIARTHTDI